MSKPDWRTPGASLSDKNARLKYGMTQEEIIAQIKAGRFQYQNNVMHGNPYYKLLRHEVEAYIIDKYGENELKRRQCITQLNTIEIALRKHKRQINALTKEKALIKKTLALLA